MSKDILDNLFGSNARVKILKFLFRSYPQQVDLKTLSERVQESSLVVKKELAAMQEIKLIKRSS